MRVPNAKQQRDAVEQVLKNYLPHPLSVQRALSIWDDHMRSGRRSLALHRYINRLEPLFETVKRQKSELLQDLINEFAVLQMVAVVPPDAAFIEPEPASQVVDLMLTVLLEGMPNVEQERLRLKLAAIARKRGDENVALWCEEGNLLLAAPSTALLHELVHQTYLTLCELFGPARADRLMVIAVKQAEHLPASLHFPPSQLL